jgi:hypothetical protein
VVVALLLVPLLGSLPLAAAAPGGGQAPGPPPGDPGLAGGGLLDGGLPFSRLDAVLFTTGCLLLIGLGVVAPAASRGREPR